jgi:hypothetical protein
MKKTVLLIICFFINICISFSDPTPLKADIKINDEIWLYGQIIFFNGWPPNIRMIVNGDKIIGIDEDSIPGELKEILWKWVLFKGAFKLKLINLYDIPYYDEPLLVFEIIQYTNIEITE